MHKCTSIRAPACNRQSINQSIDETETAGAGLRPPLPTYGSIEFKYARVSATERSMLAECGTLDTDYP